MTCRTPRAWLTSCRILCLALLLSIALACSDDDDDFGAVADDDDTTVFEPDLGSWELVASLDTAPNTGVIRYAAIHNGWYYSVEGDGVESGLSGYHRWSLEDGHHETIEWQGEAGGYFEHSGTCSVGDRAYLLGGGGNGVTIPNGDFHWEAADLASGTWLPGGHHADPYHHPATATDGGRCFLVGGWWGGLDPYNDLVQEFLPETKGWRSLAPYPVETELGYAAYLDGTLFAAGGAREGDGESQGTGWGVAEDRAFTLEVDTPDASWQAAPPLPIPLVRGHAITFEARIYVLGGFTNHAGWGDDHRTTIWSWAPGEDGWQVEGDLPHLHDTMFRMPMQVHGDHIYAIAPYLGEGESPALLRWRPE